MSILRDIGLVVGLIIALILAFVAYRELSVDRTNLYQEVKARIYNVRNISSVETSTSSVANVRIVNNRTVYNLTAQYRYLVNGKTYEGQYPVGKFRDILSAQNEIAIFSEALAIAAFSFSLNPVVPMIILMLCVTQYSRCSKVPSGRVKSIK
jgi:hypothetical protein